MTGAAAGTGGAPGRRPIEEGVHRDLAGERPFLPPSSAGQFPPT